MTYNFKDNSDPEEPESLQPETEKYLDQGAVVKVFGVGGGGCNALAQMIATKIRGVEYKCLNTDHQDLEQFDLEYIIQLGKEETRGLGAGANPEIGKLAAEESKEEIQAAIGKADILFIAAGMGGGTGTGAAAVVAGIAREMGVLTVAVVTEPFEFEGARRRNAANLGLDELRNKADSMIVVPNENLLSYLGPDVSLLEAFAEANNIVTNAVQSIAELITTSGLINLDFADVKSVMSSMGNAIMSTGTALGEKRAEKAAMAAIESPLLNNIDLNGARGILANITASSDLSMGEFHVVGDVVRSIAADDANVVIGTVLDEKMGDEIRVTVVATGIQPLNPDVRAKTVSRQPPKISPAVEAENSADTQSTSNVSEVNSDDVESDAESAVHSEESSETTTSESSTEALSLPEGSDDAASDSEPENAVDAAKAAVDAAAANLPRQAECVVCGNPSHLHAEHCPLRTTGDFYEDDDATIIQHPVHKKPTPIAKSGYKKYMVASAFGVLFLAAATYFFVSKQNMDAAKSEPPIADTQSEDEYKTMTDLLGY